MATLTELARIHTRLDGPRLAHLQRLVASWGPMADLCFADLLLFVPVSPQRGDGRTDGEGQPSRYVVIGQIRPTTNQTVYRHDFVGEVVDEIERPVVARAMRLGEIVEGEINVDSLGSRVRVVAIPVRWRDEVIAVLTREAAPSLARQPGELEQIYLEVFHRFARMIAAGDFPFAAQDTETEEAPRVGDGAIVLDTDATVDYASPNAVSALHRLGIHANAEGMRLSELGIEEDGAVTHAGRLLGLGVLGREREVAGSDHAGEAVEHLEVDLLEVAGLAGERRRRLAGEDGDHLVAPPHRDGDHPHARPERLDVDLALDDLAQTEGSGDDGPLDLVDHLAHEVVAVHGLVGRRPDLAEDDVAADLPVAGAGRHRHEEQEVGEAEVGQQAPGRDEADEVVDPFLVDLGVGPGQLGQARHAGRS